MRSIIVAWNKGDEVAFERHVPLLFNARRNRIIGSSKSFDLVFLEGMDKLSDKYKAVLSSSGYVLHDASVIYASLCDRYRNLERFGNYERNCFLRWLVIHQYFGNVPFIHYDGDVVFNETPEVLEAAFEGLTFILQGCPALTCVNDPSWLPRYTEQLDLFYNAMESYSHVAWMKRAEYVHDFKEKNGCLWDRELISSDQDLLQYTTLAGYLPQDSAATVNSRCGLALFQNPIRIARDIALPLPLTYERRNGIDYIGGCKVALWHMQSSFCDYMGYADYRKRLLVRGRTFEHERPRPPLYFSYRIFRRLSPLYERLALYERYFSDGKDLSFLLNDKTYWQPGVFF